MREVGFMIAEEFNFNSHFEMILLASFKVLGVVTRLNFVFRDPLRLFEWYRRLILSKNALASVVWNNLSDTAAVTLGLVQNNLHERFTTTKSTLALLVLQ